MRISSTKRWLAAALLGTGTVNGATRPAAAITFDNNDFWGGSGGPTNTSAIFVIAASPQPKTVPMAKKFRWTAESNVQIGKVSLYMKEEDGTSITSGSRANAGKDFQTTISSLSETMSGIWDTSSRDATAANRKATNKPPTRRQNRAGEEEDGKIKLDVQSTHVTIENMGDLWAYNSRHLYFAIEWERPGTAGTTYSRVFTVVNKDQELNIVAAADSSFSNTNPAHDPVEEPTTFTTTPTSPVSQPTSTTLPTANTSSENQDSSPSTGLATGAIIGIAVACGIVGLVLIGAIIWFLFRRRRQSADLGGPGRPYGDDRNRTEELMAEKESSAGADPSPHSPYSDEGILIGGARHEVPAAIAPVLPSRPPNDQASSYTPYSDRASGGLVGSPSAHAASIAHSEDAAAARAGMGSPTAGRATPHGSLAPQYVHLVEEGMTEEEIRRLEDEERQLDAAIEQAGRR